MMMSLLLWWCHCYYDDVTATMMMMSLLLWWWCHCYLWFCHADLKVVWDLYLVDLYGFFFFYFQYKEVTLQVRTFRRLYLFHLCWLIFFHKDFKGHLCLLETVQRQRRAAELITGGIMCSWFIRTLYKTILLLYSFILLYSSMMY